MLLWLLSVGSRLYIGSFSSKPPLTTTQYYRVLLQYYSVLQSTTPVQQSIIPYYKKYYSVLQSITVYYTVPQGTTTYYKVLLRLIVQHMKRPVQCAKQQESPPDFTKYCASHEKWFWWLILVSHERSSTMRGATGVTLQPHQILGLPPKMTLMTYHRDVWNVTYNARSNRCHPPTSPRTVPATIHDSHHWSSWHIKRHLQCAKQQDSPSNLTKYCACHVKWHAWLVPVTYETPFTMRGATAITLQPHQILRLPRQIALQNLREICRKQLKRHLQCAADSTMIRSWSEHVLVIAHPPVRRGYFSRFGDTFCIENYSISRSGYLPDFHRILRLPRKVTLQNHQMLRLPPKMARIIDPRNI